LAASVDLSAGNLVLLQTEAFVHEHVCVLLLVKVLHLRLLAVGGFQGVAPFVDAVERGAAMRFLSRTS
jgi:hypothetical protein